MVVYLSGPMTGKKDFNYPAFHQAARRWRAKGWSVLNPAENFDGAQDKEYREYMRADIEMLLKADSIAMLPGWEKSRGARFELLTAQYLGLDTYDAKTAKLKGFPIVVTEVDYAAR